MMTASDTQSRWWNFLPVMQGLLPLDRAQLGADLEAHPDRSAALPAAVFAAGRENWHAVVGDCWGWKWKRTKARNRGPARTAFVYAAHAAAIDS